MTVLCLRIQQAAQVYLNWTELLTPEDRRGLIPLF